MKNAASTTWSQEKILFLERNKNKIPPSKEWLQKFVERWPELAEHALCNDARINTYKRGEWLRYADILLALDCRTNRFNCVFKNPKAMGLLGIKQEDGEMFVPLSGLRAFAEHYPRFFKDDDLTILTSLFKSQKFALKTKRKANKKIDTRVMCVETGEIWESRTKAAKALYVSRSYLSKMIAIGSKVKALDKTFVAVDKTTRPLS